MTGRCFYCNVELRRSGNSRATKDHVVPKSHPHFTTLTETQHSINVVQCCHSCNNRKGGKHPLVWLRSVPSDHRPRLVSRLHVLGFSTGVVASALQAIPTGLDYDVRLVSYPNC